MEGTRGRKFFAREPSAKPRRPCPIEGKAEQKNTLFLLEEKSGARKIKIVKSIFLRGGPPLCGGGRRGGAAVFFQPFLIKWVRAESYNCSKSKIFYGAKQNTRVRFLRSYEAFLTAIALAEEVAK